MPKKFTDDQRRDLLNEIRDHLALEGRRKLDPLSERLGISRQTLFKLIDELNGLAGSDDAPGLLRMAQQRIKKAVEPTRDMLEAVSPQLPAPSPNIVAEKGEAVMVQFDFLREINNLYSDALMLRDYATTKDAAGAERIKNPVFFTAALNQRKNIIQTGIQAQQEVFDLNRIQEMLDAMFQAVLEEAPEAAAKVMGRWEQLNNRFGFNAGAKI
jgi:hypothetical protein